MATVPNSTTTPKCTRATTAIDALGRARALGDGVILALAGRGNEWQGLAVGAVVNAMVRELSEAEAALSPCPGNL